MTRLFAAALLALAFSPHAWAADPTPRQNYPTSADHGVAITVVPMGIDVNGFAVPCGSSTVVTGCGIGGAISATLSYTTTTTASIATTSGTLATAGQYKFLTICTLPTSTTNVWLNPNGTAVANTGIPIFAGGGCTTLGTQKMPMPITAITAITDGGSAQTITLAGG